MLHKKVARSLKIDPKLWKEIKHRAVDDEMTISKWVENAIKKELRGK